MKPAVSSVTAALVLAATLTPAQSPSPRLSPARRFVIDAHQHYEDKPDYFDRLVRTYRPRNAMACVLTPMKHFESVRKATAAHPAPRSSTRSRGRSPAWWEGPTAHSPPDAVYAFEKLVFGTDEAPEVLDNMLGRYEAMLDACGVPEASRRRIYGETMARLLGIPVRP